ncbi:MAG: DUF3472 domain-containing protein [Limisphaera sp.]|nr:DUF3472 domain-containing protein [Limisphaera sp.]
MNQVPRVRERCGARAFGPGLLALLSTGWILGVSMAFGATPEIRAARSVHLGWDGPEGRGFYLEMTVRQSTPGSYFMACGWNTGYFGIQELNSATNRVVLFSVWDPTRGDDPNAVPEDQRVQVWHSDPDVRIRRFGGEGTGAQCMWPYAWATGRTYRFFVRAEPSEDWTTYAAYFWLAERKQWKHLASFRTRTGGQWLRGYYSFVEDFRRDGRSVHEFRRAEFANVWILDADSRWHAVTRARFTASDAPWESRDNIGGGTVANGFFLETGGEDRAHPPLGSILTGSAETNQPPADLEPLLGLRSFNTPLLDLAPRADLQVVVDREPGQYLGHPSTCLLEDGRTILCVYPKGHGRGAIVYKRSEDGGRTWSQRLATPSSWATSLETPTLHRVVDAGGRRRVLLWSGLYPARLAVSEDDGRSWSELRPAGEWGGIVVMSSVVALREHPGHYLAMFHDDGRFFQAEPQRHSPPVMTLYQTFSRDGGLTWSRAQPVYSNTAIHLCEPGLVRSPDGTTLAALLRENRRVRLSHVMFSSDEGRSWSVPRELPRELTGDRHVAVYAPDGRLFVSFRDMAPGSPTHGDWVGWVGTWEDLVHGRPGQYRVRLLDNRSGHDCGYAGVVCLPEGTIVATSYGHWVEGQSPFVVTVRFNLSELDRLARKGPWGVQPVDPSHLLR